MANAVAENIFFATRLKIGKTQGEIASALIVSVSTISNWERGVASPPTSMLPAIEKVYGLKAAEISKAFSRKATIKKYGGVEQLEARPDPNRKIAGSNPAPAIATRKPSRNR